METMRYRSSVIDCLNSTKFLYSKIQKSNKIPYDLHYTGLNDIDIDILYSFHLILTEIDLLELKKRFNRENDTLKYSHELSTVIWKNKDPIGLMIVADTDLPDVKFIYAVIVLEKYRRSIVTALLKHHTFYKLHKKKVVAVIYYPHNGNLDTKRHADKIGWSCDS